MIITVVLELSGQAAYGLSPDRLQAIADTTSAAVGALIKPWSAQPRDKGEGALNIGEVVRPLSIDKATATIGE